jgi:hypothetical protein
MMTTSKPAFLRSTFVRFPTLLLQNLTHYVFYLPGIRAQNKTYLQVSPLSSLLFTITCPLYTNAWGG